MMIGKHTVVHVTLGDDADLSEIQVEIEIGDNLSRLAHRILDLAEHTDAIDKLLKLKK